MPFVDPWLQEGARSPIQWEQRLYEQTRNPIYVWNALRICAQLDMGEGLPPWIAEYLSRVADGLLELDDGRPVPDLGAAVTGVLGLKQAGQGRRTDAYADRERTHRDRTLVLRVRRYLRKNPDAGLMTAFAHVAEDSQVSEDVCRKAWKAWGWHQLD
jgi:hypothetical protein